MSNPSAHYAVLFSDIVSSSKLFQELGNRAAKKRLKALLEQMTESVITAQGFLVKTIGDEILAHYPTPESACESAIAMNLKAHSNGYSLRTGIAYGPAVLEVHDIYGDTVNAAATLTKTANPSEILVDEPSMDILPPWLANHSTQLDRFPLKGRSGSCDVFRLNWRQDTSQQLAITQVDSAPRPNLEPEYQLQIRSRDKTMIMNSNDAPLVIGRDPLSVALAVEDTRVSRNHCSIAFHRGKFVVEDHSTNGSYIQESGQGIVHLRRESAPLVRKGHINLGNKQSNGYNSISYCLLQ